MRAGVRAGDFGGNRKADMEIEVLEKISQSREEANGFTTALKCCIACPSIPQIRGFIYVREHRSAQPRERRLWYRKYSYEFSGHEEDRLESKKWVEEVRH